jgi:hypothetical protein
VAHLEGSSTLDSLTRQGGTGRYFRNVVKNPPYLCTQPGRRKALSPTEFRVNPKTKKKKDEGEKEESVFW